MAEALRLLQSKQGCFAAGVCKSLPCLCAEEVAASRGRWDHPTKEEVEAKDEAQIALCHLDWIAAGSSTPLPWHSVSVIRQALERLATSQPDRSQAMTGEAHSNASQLEVALSEYLADPDWRPRRAHIERARNDAARIARALSPQPDAGRKG